MRILAQEEKEEEKEEEETSELDPKILALAKFLGEDPDEIEESTYSENTFDFGNQEYLVLTDEEADAAVKEMIEEDLWAFNPSFLTSYINIPEEAIKALQEKMYEDASPVFMKLLGDDFDHFVSDAVASDGRGHFLSGYDGAENEEVIDGVYYFIYRRH